jgi:MFS family permease
MPILIAPLLGPVVAGLILKYAGWPWLFYMSLPFGVLAVLLAMLLLPGEETRGVSHPFDSSGFVLLSPGIACVLYGLDHAAQRGGRLFLILGVILIGSFIRHAIRKGAAALIEPSAVRESLIFDWNSNAVFFQRCKLRWADASPPLSDHRPRNVPSQGRAGCWPRWVLE